MLGFIVVGSCVTAFGVQPPSPAVTEALGQSGVTAWSWTLLVCAALSLLGMFWPGRLATALAVEQVGLVMLTACAGAYGVVLTSTLARGSATAASFVLGVAFASLWRVVQIYGQQERLIRVQATLDRRRAR